MPLDRDRPRDLVNGGGKIGMHRADGGWNGDQRGSHIPQSISRDSWRLPLRISSPKSPGSGLRPPHTEMPVCRDMRDAGLRPCAAQDEGPSS
jgi:hypothetical protein